MFDKLKVKTYSPNSSKASKIYRAEFNCKKIYIFKKWLVIWGRRRDDKIIYQSTHSFKI